MKAAWPTSGNRFLHGTPPYQDAYHEKLPGIYLAYAAMMAAFGESAAGIHLGLLVVNLLTIVLVFLLARDTLDALAGGIAAAAYVAVGRRPYDTGHGRACHALRGPVRRGGRLGTARPCGPRANSCSSRAGSSSGRRP